MNNPSISAGRRAGAPPRGDAGQKPEELFPRVSVAQPQLPEYHRDTRDQDTSFGLLPADVDVRVDAVTSVEALDRYLPSLSFV